MPAAITSYAETLWLAGARRLIRVAPDTKTVSEAPELPMTTGVAQLLGATQGLFATGVNDSQIWTVDPKTGAAAASTALPNGELVLQIADAGGQIWAAGNCGDLAATLPQVDPVRVSDTSQQLQFATTLGSLWVCDEVHAELVRLDQRTRRITARLPVPAADPDDPAFAVVTGRHSVWLVDSNLANGILRVDPDTGTITRLTRSRGTSGVVVTSSPT